MIRVVGSGGAHAAFEAEIRAMLNFKADLSGLESEITRIVQETNREDRLEGVDRHGGYLLALAPSTSKKRSGSPIPFVEHGAASRVIANLIVDVQVSTNGLGVSLMWIGMPWLRFHLDGGPVIPQRDFAGLSPWALPLIDAAVVRASDAQFPGTKRPSGVARGVGHGRT